MGVMIPSDPWLTYRSAQLPLFRMIFLGFLLTWGSGLLLVSPTLESKWNLGTVVRIRFFMLEISSTTD